MACEGAPMNKFRSAVLSGKEGAREVPLIAEKKRARDAAAKGLGAVPVPRSETRTTDQRGDNRHRLPAESATVRHKNKLHKVELINLSGGGAMIAGNLKPKLWDRIDLVLGEFGEIESAVRWIRGDRIGVEFAHETRIACPAPRSRARCGCRPAPRRAPRYPPSFDLVGADPLRPRNQHRPPSQHLDQRRAGRILGLLH